MAADVATMELQASIDLQVSEGLKLLSEAHSGVLDMDEAAATDYKAQIDQRLAALEEEVSKLTGKDHKKERTAKGREVLDLKGDPKYVDACRVVRGLEPVHGHFLRNPPPQKVSPAPAPVAAGAGGSDQAGGAARDESPISEPEEPQEGGLTAKEARELERLREDIRRRKELLRAEGQDYVQQSLDPQIEEWTDRFDELKAKASMDPEEFRKLHVKKMWPTESKHGESERLLTAMEECKQNLRARFGYTFKQLKGDPELRALESRLAALGKVRGGA